MSSLSLSLPLSMADVSLLNVHRDHPNQSSANVSIRSDGTAVVREVFRPLGSEESTSSNLAVNDLPRATVRDSVRVLNKHAPAATRWIDTSRLDPYEYLQIYGGSNPTVTIETETKSAAPGGGTVLSSVSGKLIQLNDHQATLHEADGKGLTTVVLEDRLLRIRLQSSSKYARPERHDSQLFMAFFDKAQPACRLQYNLEAGALSYRVVHRLELSDEQARAVHWTSEVLVYNRTGMRLYPVITIVERKQDTRQGAPVIVTPPMPRPRGYKKSKSRSMRRGGGSSDDEAPQSAAPEAAMAYAMAPPPPPVQDQAGITDLEMTRVVNEAAVIHLTAREDWTRYAFRKQRDVPCRFFFLHSPSDGAEQFSETQRQIDWEKRDLLQGDFIFSGAVQALSADQKPLHDGSMWYDAWNAASKQLLKLGTSQRVTARRVNMGSNVDEQASTERHLIRIEYQNQSPVEVMVKLVEQVRDSSAQPIVEALLQRNYADTRAPDSVARLLESPTPAGWASSTTQDKPTKDLFQPYVEEYVEEQERRADPFRRVAWLRVPAGSSTNLAQPGRLVLFYKITYVRVSLRVTPVSTPIAAQLPASPCQKTDIHV